jgi:hypothetical protein
MMLFTVGLGVLLSFIAAPITGLLVRLLYRRYGHPAEPTDQTRYLSQKRITTVFGRVEFVVFFVSMAAPQKTSLGGAHHGRDVADPLAFLITAWLAAKTLGYEAGPLDPRAEVDETSRHYIYLLGTGSIIALALTSGWLASRIL